MRNPLRSSQPPADAELETRIGQVAELVSPRCGARSSLGHRCQEPAGHDGPHRDPRGELIVRWGAEHEPVSLPLLQWGP